jgi:hypothetical protein
MTKILMRSPESFSSRLVTTSGEKMVPAERAIYTVVMQFASRNEAVVAFYDSQTKQSWVGQQMPVYVSTGAGIVGFWTSVAGLEWTKSMLNGAGTDSSLAQLWAAFDENVSAAKLVEPFQRIPLGLYLDREFFETRTGTSLISLPTIDSVSVANGQIVLNLSSQDGELHARVVIDAKTLELISAKMVKKEVFSLSGG